MLLWGDGFDSSFMVIYYVFLLGDEFNSSFTVIQFFVFKRERGHAIKMCDFQYINPIKND